MTSSAVVRVNWPPRFHGISRLHLSELRLWLCSSAAHPTLFTGVPRRGVLGSSYHRRNRNLSTLGPLTTTFSPLPSSRSCCLRSRSYRRGSSPYLRRNRVDPAPARLRPRDHCHPRHRGDPRLCLRISLA